ncbi:YihY/virulence factor BrkB family protein, partial [Janibacter sp. RAF20_2_2]
MANDESTATEDLAPEEEGLDEEVKPSIREMKKRGWTMAVKRAIKEFSADGCTDLAAALTYFSVLSIFPALLALVSIIGLVGDPQETKQTLLDVIGQLG